MRRHETNATALVSGLLWGARNGVQFSLTFTALKALPLYSYRYKEEAATEPLRTGLIATLREMGADIECNPLLAPQVYEAALAAVTNDAQHGVGVPHLAYLTGSGHATTCTTNHVMTSVTPVRS